MENASKALLIAAGVLIVIIIIAISMKIFNSTNGIESYADEVGKAIKTESKDASKDAISKLKDTTSKNLISIPAKRYTASNSSYSVTRTNFFVEPKKTYILQFDYKIYESKYKVCCGVGVIHPGYGPDYNQDLNAYANYPNQDEGTCIVRFKTNAISEPLELCIRFARMERSGNFDVYISNVELREEKK